MHPRFCRISSIPNSSKLRQLSKRSTCFFVALLMAHQRWRLLVSVEPKQMTCFLKWSHPYPIGSMVAWYIYRSMNGWFLWCSLVGKYTIGNHGSYGYCWWKKSTDRLLRLVCRVGFLHVRWLAGFMKINSSYKIYPLFQFQGLHSKSQDIVKLCNYYCQSNTTRTNIPVYVTYIAIQVYVLLQLRLTTKNKTWKLTKNNIQTNTTHPFACTSWLPFSIIRALPRHHHPPAGEDDALATWDFDPSSGSSTGNHQDFLWTSPNGCFQK